MKGLRYPNKVVLWFTIKMKAAKVAMTQFKG